jgi:hypothetical protein
VRSEVFARIGGTPSPIQLADSKRPVRSQFVLGDLQHDEVTRSCGEVNRLIGRPLVEASLAVHLAHCDLTGKPAKPK